MKHAIVLAAVIVLGCGATPSPTSSSSPAASAPASPSAPPSAIAEGFPTEVLGMPVLSVGGVNQLIAQGKLDGRVAAVGGWWIQVTPPMCPAPGRWMAELESWCFQNIFASRPFQETTCIYNPDGTGTCHGNTPPPDTDVLNPITVSETGGLAGLAADPNWAQLGYVRAVVVGHAGDERQWNCPAETRADCAREFVIDRFAWVEGHDIPLSATGIVETRLTADQAAATADLGAFAVAAYSTDASDASTFDPRLHGIGSGTVWAVRTIAKQGASAEDPTRPGDVWLVDDATGGLVQSLPLKPEDSFSPALLRLQATQAEECCPNNSPLPMYSVAAADGEGIAESFTDGWESGTRNGGTQWHAGAPVILTAGDYVVTFGLAAPGEGGNVGPLLDGCQTTISVVNGQDARLEAAFPKTGACSFVTPTFEDPFGG